MEVFNTGFYGRELKGKDFKYTNEEKIVVKRKILETLPNVDSILNIN